MLKMKEGYTLFKPLLRYNDQDIIKVIRENEIPILTTDCKYKEFRPKRLFADCYIKMDLYFDYDKVMKFAQESLILENPSSYTILTKRSSSHQFFKKMKKLLLINPVGRRSGYLVEQIFHFSTTKPSLYLSAVTPSHWDIKIIDENIDEFKFEEADLVGITGFTSSINRAYEIARLYRKKKIKVIMGGIHYLHASR